jgi:hypothetical protein
MKAAASCNSLSSYRSPVTGCWDNRTGSVIDLSGYQWTTATRKEDFSPAELDERAQEFFKQFAAEGSDGGDPVTLADADVHPSGSSPRGLDPLGRTERRDQARSNRSRFMTLSHAATKSSTNLRFESLHA